MANLAFLESFWDPLLPHRDLQCDASIPPQKPQKSIWIISQTSDDLEGVSKLGIDVGYGHPNLYS